MKPGSQSFFDAIARAHDLDGITHACALFGQAQVGVPEPDFSRYLADAVHAHLWQHCRSSRFRQWIDVYFGRTAMQFPVPLQRPTFIYYPGLTPGPWFEPGSVEEWTPLEERLSAVHAELRDFIDSASGFEPYVGAEAVNDERWRQLSGNQAWSSIHLLLRNARADLLSGLPETRALLDAMPLAQCPPHAPECFVSRLSSQAVIPPHHGLSNIKVTVHVPIRIPESGCSITVGGETRQWSNGSWLAFDDSFLHSARNLSASDRSVLIFDAWHPDLSQPERRGLAHAIAVLEEVNRVTRSDVR